MKKEPSQVSAVVLAGGKSTRMGSDKAFLRFKGRPFIAIIVDELSKISDDILVVIGKKQISKFKTILNSNIRILKDSYDLKSPASGILTALDQVKHPMTAILSCDNPMLKAEIIEFLRLRCINRSAAVPTWPNGDIEPLCSVYNVLETKKALLKAAAKFGKIGPRHIISEMKDVNYVNVSKLKPYDKNLVSLINVNSRKDYSQLLKRTSR